MRSWWLAATVVVWAAMTGRAHAEPTELETKVGGTWIVVGVNREGQDIEADKLVVNKIGFRFSGEKVTVSPSKNFGGFGPARERDATFGTVKREGKPDLGTFDLAEIPGNGTARAEKVLAIYKLDGDTMKIALAYKAGAMRPEAFETATDSEFIVYTLAREKNLTEAFGDATGTGAKRGLIGTWVPESAQLGGRELPNTELRTIRFTFDEFRLKHSYGDGEDAIITVDALKQPVLRVDFENRNRLEMGIVEVRIDKNDSTGASDILRICVNTSRSGGRRPSKFESPYDSDIMLITLKREIKTGPVPSP